ncbi:MAG TPA: hypothetical protein VIV60_12110, partial [Polyangiaceae bacterium]
MTPRELDDRLTPLDIPSLWNALLLKWETLGVEPRRRAIELKLAHIHLETGLKSCHNYNLGNIKSLAGDGRHWQYFACGEEVAEHTLDEVLRLQANCVTVKARYHRDASPWASLWITPKHPWTKFAAFETLSDGVDAQLGYLRSPKHEAVLASLQTGDPVVYNDALVAHGYYTAGKTQYLATLQ